MKKILIVLLCGVFLFSFNLVTAQQNQGQQGIHDAGTGIANPDLKESSQGLQAGGEKSVLRKSRVSNAVQSMLEVAERNQSVGQQIRNIAQNQIQVQEEAEGALEMAQQRKGFMKFLVGPDYSQLKTVEDRLNRHNQNLEQLRALKEDIDDADTTLFDEQIQIMEEVKQEMENELGESRSGFSLFGWINKLFNS